MSVASRILLFHCSGSKTTALHLFNPIQFIRNHYHGHQHVDRPARSSAGKFRADDPATGADLNLLTSSVALKNVNTLTKEPLQLRRSGRITNPTSKALKQLTMPTVPAKTAKASKSTAKKGKASATKSKAVPAAKSIFPNLSGAVSASSGSTKKRKTTDAAEKSASKAPPAKRPKTETVKPTPVKATARATKPRAIINQAPDSPLHVYVFGEGSSGELGLGDARNAIDVKRPRLNPHLLPEKVGVVHLACGGMHVAALTRDGKVLTWGVNDQGALGRDTKWEGGLRDMDADSDDEDSTGLNPLESTPGAITTFPEGTVIVKLSAGDSHTLALTDDGKVFGWGTFRVS